MAQMNVQQVVGILLAVVMLRPFPVVGATPAAVLGSISSYGPVIVGQAAAPPQSSLLAGDIVQTRTGTAVIRYKEGARILLDQDSKAQFSPSDVQLQEGRMSFHSAPGTVFRASSLIMEPAASPSSAHVSVKDGKASLSVSEGAVRAVDPTGVLLAVVRAGETQLFAMASPSAAPAASATAPQPPQAAAAALLSPLWLLVLGAGAVAATVGIQQAIRANNSDDRSSELERRLGGISPGTP